jgi:hypothetical protein
MKRRIARHVAPHKPKRRTEPVPLPTLASPVAANVALLMIMNNGTFDPWSDIDAEPTWSPQWLTADDNRANRKAA